jgi:hypothetical protein
VQDQSLSGFLLDDEYQVPDLSEKVFLQSVRQNLMNTSSWDDEELRRGWELVDQWLRPVRGGLLITHPDEVWDDLDWNTSPGYPWNHQHMTKSDLLLSGKTPVVLAQDLISRLDRVEGSACIFSFFLKDELIKRSKAAEGRYRIICGAPVDHTIVLGSLCKNIDAELERCRHLTPIKIGIDPFSTEWDRLARDLRRFPNFWVADFKGFEYTKDPQEDSYICLWRCGKLAESRRLYPLMRKLYRQMSFAVAIDQLGNFYQLFGGTRSGTFTTCSDNSLLDLRYISSAFCSLCPDLVMQDHVALGIFGDDLAMSVSDEAKFRFHPSAIKEYFSNHGITLTGSNDWVPWSSVDFLSMGFVRHPWLDLWVPVPRRANKLILSMTCFSKEMSLSDRLMKMLQIRRLCCFDDHLWSLCEHILDSFLEKNGGLMSGDQQWEHHLSLRMDRRTACASISGLPIIEAAGVAALKKDVETKIENTRFTTKT